ncbi:hypothetical protein GPECTOR_29g18 [Gonium pectorale]|uniref:Endonuclease/exonuclease/phosphatase domain-containing protein n=1 Tax=Gonium pectorale TaxID=33097 RepID=A0A150GEF8_GONPE|nr:hypothetical protein GPECTOR_29g18 [Gonium pectorale]|eukprot:KXZ48237.1 hypothetical protein GPECTOR_29g18 [Gonium pectorale]
MHFRSGVFGSGLLTLSRHPITEAAFHQYTCAGDPASIHCGDYLAAKGVGWTRLSTPSGPLDVFNTHLHANYSHKYDKPQGQGPQGAAEEGVPPPAVDDFAAFRMAQVLELARFVNSVSGRGGSLGAVLGGDLNAAPHTLEAAVLRSLLPQLRDSWLEGREGSSGDPGHTCKAADNSFQPRRQVPERIDYVLTSLKVSGCQLALKRTPDGYSFSDHFAVHTRLTLPDAPLPPPPASASSPLTAPASDGNPSRRAALLSSAHGVVAEGAKRAVQASAGHISFALIMIMQAAFMCVFEPVMTTMGHTINPIMRLLIPAAAALLALGAGLMALVGFVADAGQARSLQQAQQQLAVALEGARGAEAAGGGGAGTAGSKGTASKRR